MLFRSADLVARARQASTGRARICLHADHADPVQEMVIALRQDSPIPAHRQIAKLRKSYHLLEGQIRIVLFSETGRRDQEVILGTDDQHPRIFTFPAARWQACAALTPVSVYVETIAGPFDPSGVTWQPWMP